MIFHGNLSLFTGNRINSKGSISPFIGACQLTTNIGSYFRSSGVKLRRHASFLDGYGLLGGGLEQGGFRPAMAKNPPAFRVTLKRSGLAARGRNDLFDKLGTAYEFPRP